MAKRHPHKWDMGADGTLIAVLFTAVEVLPYRYIEVRNYVCLPHFTAQPLRYTGISPTKLTVHISTKKKKHNDGLYFWGFLSTGLFLGMILILSVNIRVLVSLNTFSQEKLQFAHAHGK